MDILIVKKKYGSFERFDGAKNANKCLPYDFVNFTENGCTLIKRTIHPLLVGVLETTGPKYGLTSHNHPIYLCKPLDTMYPPFYIGSKIIDPVYNKLITFKFDSWSQNSEFPKGTFINLLGNCGEYEAEKKAVKLKASPYVWPKILNPIIHPSNHNRTILSGYTFNIDPDGCKDIDDCITIYDNKIAISIADVSAWVQSNPWMRFAEAIGTSIYENGKCVKPMFPPIVSEDLMSLVKDKERLAYSLIITFDTLNTITYEFKETIVKVNKSYTYDTFNKSEYLEPLKKYVYLLSGIDTIDSHKLVELLMLYYNTKAGEVLKEKNKGILRKQTGKNVDRAKLFEQFSDTYMFIAYESAEYCLPNGNTSHAFLNANAYAHASSPIRRYVDIINQMALKSIEFSYECIERFNILQKRATQFERDLLFLDLYFNNKHIVDAIVLSDTYIYIPILKKLLDYKNSFEKHQTIQLKYYCDPQKILWKEKIIFKL